MASAWGSSWGDSWGNSWGDIGAIVVVTEPPVVGGGLGKPRKKPKPSKPRKLSQDELLRLYQQQEPEKKPPEPEPEQAPQPPEQVVAFDARVEVGKREEFQRGVAEVLATKQAKRKANDLRNLKLRLLLLMAP